MKKIIRILTVMTIVVLESSLTNALNQTADHSPAESTTMFPSPSSVFPFNHKNSSELLERSSFEVSSSLQVAEPRQFPVGSPDLIPTQSNLHSPFDVSSFGKQLLPLINVNIKEKVKDFARTFNDGADLIEDAIRESWKESPLNPHNFPNLLDSANIFKSTQSTNSLRKPVAQSPKAHKAKAPKAIETYSNDALLHEYGIDGYKHFEESILRELEKQEERKVEATIHTLFEHGSRVEIIHGKPYDYKSGWNPVAAPTKTYGFESEDINSQIISPLHTSIFSASQEASSNPLNFHDFDNLSGHNTIHSTYSVSEEAGESKVKPVKARITPVRKVTPSPVATRSSAVKTSVKPRYRKRQSTNNKNSTVAVNQNRHKNINVINDNSIETKLAKKVNNNHIHNGNSNETKPVKLESIVIPDAGSSQDRLRNAMKTKRTPSRHYNHIQSLTTTKPRNHLLVSPSKIVEVEEAPTFDTSKENFGRVSYAYGSEVPSRLRSTTTTKAPTKSTAKSTKTTKATTTTTTTEKPTRNVVAREVAKFVDRPKATGFRGSVKFGQSTTKNPN